MLVPIRELIILALFIVIGTTLMCRWVFGEWIIGISAWIVYGAWIGYKVQSSISDKEAED